MVTRLDRDVAIHSRPRIVGAVASPVDDLRALVRRGNKCVIAAEGEFAGPRTEAGFGALPARLAEVGEIAEAGLFRCDEQKIVVICSTEPARAPAQIAFERSANAGFERFGHDLF